MADCPIGVDGKPGRVVDHPLQGLGMNHDYCRRLRDGCRA